MGVSPCSGSCARNAKGGGDWAVLAAAQGCPSWHRYRGQAHVSRAGGPSETVTPTPAPLRGARLREGPRLAGRGPVDQRGGPRAPGSGARIHIISLPDGLFMSLKSPPPRCHRPPAGNTARPPGRGPARSSGQGQGTLQPARGRRDTGPGLASVPSLSPSYLSHRPQPGRQGLPSGQLRVARVASGSQRRGIPASVQGREGAFLPVPGQEGGWEPGPGRVPGPCTPDIELSRGGRRMSRGGGRGLGPVGGPFWPRGSAGRDRGHLLIFSNRMQRETHRLRPAVTPQAGSLAPGAELPKVRVPPAASLRARSLRPPQLLRVAAGQEVERGRGRCLGRGEGPSQRPAPAPPRPWPRPPRPRAPSAREPRSL